MHRYDGDDETTCRTCHNIRPQNLHRYALQHAVAEHSWNGNDGEIDVANFLYRRADEIASIYFSAIDDNRSIKYFFRLEVELSRVVPDDDDTTTVQRTTALFATPPSTSATDPTIDFETLISKFETGIEEFTKRGSNWTVDKISRLTMHVGTFRPLVGCSFIPTPPALAGKKAVKNIQNVDDNWCFQYCILASLHPVKANAHFPSSYAKFMHELNMNDIDSPVALSSIPKFEQQNPTISVNVLVQHEGDIAPIYNSHFCNTRQHHVNLLMLTSDDGKYHYTLVTSLSRLVGDRTRHDGKTHVCHFCLHPFAHAHSLNAHLPECSRHPPQKVTYPKPGENTLKFDNIHFTQPVAFCLYADFECVLRPDDVDVAVHELSGFCCLRTSIYEEHDHRIVTYSGPNVMQKFLEHVAAEERAINEILSAKTPMRKLDVSERKAHDEAVVCATCDEPFTSKNVKTLHHDHVTGAYVAPTCNNCNLQLKSRKFGGNKYFLPVVFHNSRSYDSHFILKEFNDTKAKISAIPSNSEKFLSIQIDNMRFIDSVQFLPEKLEKLVESMAKDDTEHFKHTRLHFGADPLVYQKGIYPYEYVTSTDVLLETQLPPIEKFHSKLNDEDVKQEEYERAIKMWNKFNCRTLRDYHDLYLSLDVTLLCDVFEHFREMAMRDYGLDPLHNYTLPGFSWQCALKMTNANLELVTDPDIFLFFENSIRGGISMISNRYARANNRYLPPAVDFDENLPESYILYLDCNNLYACSLSQPLPVGNFRFLNDDEVANFDVANVDCMGDTGYVLEVDISYPTDLHATHNDYPLAPEHVTVTRDMVSDYNKDDNTRPFTKQDCLVPTLMDKEKYVTHIRNLKLYVSLGLVVTKIHRIVAFDQRAWLEPYIDFNTCKRRNAKTEFEKDFYKLMNNSVFGKSMESVRKRMNVKLINDKKRFEKSIAKPTCKRFVIINDNLVMVECARKTVKQNKPLYVGFVVLELSKVLMYNFHYNMIRKRYDAEMAKLLFTDTDSLCYHIKTEDVYRDMLEDMDYYDTSNYPPDHFLYSKQNEKVIGKFKDETKSVPPLEFCGLRSKMYSLKCGKITKRTAKGIKKSYMKHHLKHEAFLKALRKEKLDPAEFQTFKSSNHVVKTVTIKKIGLSPYDMKRYILPDGISTLAYGHYKIVG